jgi:hypothetical protein
VVASRDQVDDLARDLDKLSRKIVGCSAARRQPSSSSRAWSHLNAGIASTPLEDPAFAFLAEVPTR